MEPQKQKKDNFFLQQKYFAIYPNIYVGIEKHLLLK